MDAKSFTAREKFDKRNHFSFFLSLSLFHEQMPRETWQTISGSGGGTQFPGA